MKKLLVCALLMCPLIASAEDNATIFPWKHSPWTWNNTVMQGAVIAVQAADWAQTRQFVDNKPGEGAIYETNRLLKKIPGYVDLYFPATMLLNTTIAYVLPEPFRTMYQAGTLAFTAHLVGRNKSLGVKIKF